MPGCALSSYVEGGADDELLDLPCYCWLLRAGEDVVLVDSGPDARASTDVGYAVSGDTRRSLLGGLRAAGLTPSDVDVLVHTHLHQDHVQNDHLFHPRRVVVQRRELEEARASDAACARLSPAERAALAAAPYETSQAAGIWYIGTAALEACWGDRVEPVDGPAEVLPGLRVVPSGAHTAGHQSVLADTADGVVCLAGDVVPLAANATRVGPMTPDAAAAHAFLAQAAAAGWELIPSHEPALRTHRWFLPPSAP